MKFLPKEAAHTADNAKTYFLVAVIAALVVVNAWLIIKKQFFTPPADIPVSNVTQLKMQLDSVSTQLNLAALNNMPASQLTSQHRQAMLTARNLGSQLSQSKISPARMQELSMQIARLKVYTKDFIQKYNSYRQHQHTAATPAPQPHTVQKPGAKNAPAVSAVHHSSPAPLVYTAANITMQGFKLKSAGTVSPTTYASKASLILIRFKLHTLPPDASAEKQNLYLRIFDPAGNLIADNDDIFTFKGQKMQYTTRSILKAGTSGETYQISFKNPQPFLKGTYTTIIYINNSIAGQEQLTFY